MNSLYVRWRSIFDAAFQLQHLHAALTPEGARLLDALLAHKHALRLNSKLVADSDLRVLPAHSSRSLAAADDSGAQLLLQLRSPLRHVFGPADRLLIFTTRSRPADVLAAAGVPVGGVQQRPQRRHRQSQCREQQR